MKRMGVRTLVFASGLVGPGLVALGLVGLGLAMLIGRGALAEDAPTALKSGTGDDVASANCNVCHTSDYIVMNSTFLTHDGWKAEVTKMRTAFGAPIDEATAAQIVAYLGTHYAVKDKP